MTTPGIKCPQCKRFHEAPSVQVKCTKCGKYCERTLTCTRCNDCAINRKRDAAGRLLASRCVDCCPTGHGNHSASPSVLIELSEQIELLDGLKSNIEGRLLAVETPTYVISHAERLEANACELYDKAQAIRVALAEDTAGRNDLTLELVRLECEIRCCQSELQRGVRRSAKGYISGIVAEFLKRYL